MEIIVECTGSGSIIFINGQEVSIAQAIIMASKLINKETKVKNNPDRIIKIHRESKPII